MPRPRFGSSTEQALQDNVTDIEPEETDDVEREEEGDGEQEEFGTDQEGERVVAEVCHGAEPHSKGRR